MKVLIIDDETHVRDGIKLLANWQNAGVNEILEAENGRIAQEIIMNEKPQIIFTDMMMPELDGRQLLKWIYKEQITSKVIVVTGYEDYQFMREAIQNGASDYLLKPIDPDTLNETLNKVVIEWQRQEALRHESNKDLRLLYEILPYYRDQQLTNAIIGNSYDLKIFQKFEASKDMLQVMIIKLRNIEAFIGIWSEELSYFAILNVVNELLQNMKTGIAFRNTTENHEICVVYWGEDCDAFAQKVYEELISIVPFPFHIAISNQYFAEQIHHAYIESKEILFGSNLLEIKSTPIYKQENSREYRPFNLVELHKILDLILEKQDIFLFDDLVNRILSHTKEQHYFPFSEAIIIHQEIILFVNRWLKNMPPNFQTVRLEAFWNGKGNFEVREYFSALREMIETLLSQLKQPNKEVNSIEEIAYYIQQNYSEEISLQEFSERFFLSREYISRKFKQIYGENLSDYLVRTRINKAKELLKFPNLKIYEIAEKIGYQDDKYFRKIFKKIVGMTPNEFRKEFEIKSSS